MKYTLFVYGTLKGGFPNDWAMDSQEFVDDATIQAKLYDTGYGFPAIGSGSETVFGEIWKVDEEAKAKIDRLEGSIYKEMPVSALLIGDGNIEMGYVEATAYFWAGNVDKLMHIPEGEWIK